MDIKKIFGNNLQKYRKVLGLSQEEMAERLEISVDHLSRVELGKKFVSASLIEKIFDEINVSPSALFYSPENNVLDNDDITNLFKIFDKGVKEIKEKMRQDIELKEKKN